MPDLIKIESLKVKNKVIANLVENIRLSAHSEILNSLIEYTSVSSYEIFIASIEKTQNGIFQNSIVP